MVSLCQTRLNTKSSEGSKLSHCSLHTGEAAQGQGKGFLQWLVEKDLCFKPLFLLLNSFIVIVHCVLLSEGCSNK